MERTGYTLHVFSTVLAVVDRDTCYCTFTLLTVRWKGVHAHTIADGGKGNARTLLVIEKVTPCASMTPYTAAADVLIALCMMLKIHK